MKLLVIALAFSMLAAPAFAQCWTSDVVTGTSDQANHQSSLSSTTEGGATHTPTTTCSTSD